MTINAIQVGSVTVLVPPCSVTKLGAVAVQVVIIILVSSCEWLTAMITE